MFSYTELFISFRYLKSRKRENIVSLVSGFSFLGITLGVATLIVVQAVMVGFKEEFTDRIIGANPHIIVQLNKNLKDLNSSINLEKVRTIRKEILDERRVKHLYPVITGQVMAAKNGRYSGLQVIGIRKQDLIRIELISNPENKI